VGAAIMMQEFVLDGRKIESDRAFLSEFSLTVPISVEIVSNVDRFNDVLRGGYGTPDGGFILRWTHSSHSRAKFKKRVIDFDDLVRLIRQHGPGGIEGEDNVILILE
jgi:RNAse (barnase) inhibitor barstar